jgi:hypothetical protein
MFKNKAFQIQMVDAKKNAESVIEDTPVHTVEPAEIAQDRRGLYDSDRGCRRCRDRRQQGIDHHLRHRRTCSESQTEVVTTNKPARALGFPESRVS